MKFLHFQSFNCYEKKWSAYVGLMVFVNQTEKETRKSQNFAMRKVAFKSGLSVSLMSLVRILREDRVFPSLFD